MKKIRRSVFETNSSSTHSISISDSDELRELPTVDENGFVIVGFGEFGWEEESYHDVVSRLEYAATWAFEYGNEKHKEMLIEAIKEVTKCKEVKFDELNDGYWENGYIDHQSSDVCEEAFKDKETLKRFLFNDDSSFKTDNDNH